MASETRREDERAQACVHAQVCAHTSATPWHAAAHPRLIIPADPLLHAPWKERALISNSSPP